MNIGIIETVNFEQFCDKFYRAGRGKSFSRDGLEYIFNYLEEESEIREEYIELCIDSVCGAFVEVSAEDLEDYYPSFELERYKCQPNADLRIIKALEAIQETKESPRASLLKNGNFLLHIRDY